MLRVTVFGPESTGKTTLARHLSRRFNGLYMPEFGRVYTHALGIEEAAWQPHQLSEIASQHAMLREEIEARGGARLMVEDTDVVKTAIWSTCCVRPATLALTGTGRRCRPLSAADARNALRAGCDPHARPAGPA